MSLLAIDPGLQGTGIAMWEGRSREPFLVTIVKSRSGCDTWIDRVRDIASQVLDLVNLHDVDTIICEFMEMHQSARAQMMWRSGDFQRTLFLIGTIHGMAIENQVKRFVVTPPSEWKGQLPKGVVEKRITKILGVQCVRRLGIQSHEWDAVGIGLWYRRILK